MRSPDVSVVIVDDQPVFRQAARAVVEAAAGFTSAGEAASGEEALAVVDRREPDLVLVDVRMPGMDGIETARRLRQAHPGVVVVLITIEDPADYRPAAATSGAAALVRKQDFGLGTLGALWRAHGAPA